MQNRFTIAASLLALAATTAAQNTSPVSLPPGLEKNGYGGSGTGHATIVGAHSESRIQILNDDLKGGGLRSWKEISFRRASSLAVTPSPNNTARAWKNVTIGLGNSVYAAASTTFSTNYTAAPTNVFSGSMNFPAISGTIYNPSWGNFGGAGKMTFPFKNPYFYGASTGVIVDMRFTGGAFAAGDYIIDGIDDANGAASNEAVAFWYGKAGQCYAPTYTVNGYVEPVAITYGPNYKDANGSSAYAGMIGIHFNGVRLPPNATTVVLLQTGGWRAANHKWGIPTCQGISIKPNDPWIPLFFKTTAAGTVDTSANPSLIKYSPAFANVRMWTQAFYDVPGGIDGAMAISHWTAAQAPATKHRVFYNHSGNAGSATGMELTKDLPIVLFK